MAEPIILGKKKDKKFLTLFLLFLPSLLLAMTGSIPSTYVKLAFQLILLIFHLVIFKNLLDDFYGD
jgi:hypothetical protein